MALHITYVSKACLQVSLLSSYHLFKAFEMISAKLSYVARGLAYSTSAFYLKGLVLQSW